VYAFQEPIVAYIAHFEGKKRACVQKILNFKMQTLSFCWPLRQIGLIPLGNEFTVKILCEKSRTIEKTSLKQRKKDEFSCPGVAGCQPCTFWPGWRDLNQSPHAAWSSLSF
jgi:hypothetical protein